MTQKFLKSGQFTMYNGFAIIKFGSSYAYTKQFLYGFPQFSGKELWFDRLSQTKLYIDKIAGIPKNLQTNEA